MSKRSLWRLGFPLVVAVAGLLGLGLALTAQPQSCAACTKVTVPGPCGVNLSAVTIKQGDARRVWWNFLAPRVDQTVHVYLGINNNTGTGSPQYTYQLSYYGDWDPAAAGGITPTMGAGQLGPAGSSKANTTIEINVPYSSTQTGDLILTADVKSVDGLCASRSPVSTTIRLNQTGPTVWPITPRLSAGRRQTRTDVRRAQSGQHSVHLQHSGPAPRIHRAGPEADQFSINGQGGQASLPPLTLRPGETKEVKLTCETFGYCFTGGENRVGIRASSAITTDAPYEAVAWSSVTIRDPNANCPEIQDWWFLMSPALLALLIGAPTAASALGGGAYWVTHRGSKPPPSPPERPKGQITRPSQIEPKKPGGKNVTHGRR
ncbi:MAG: hypothetical protein IPO15_21680 [Anaerolineae bacterium]|uniref:hypothetical protein n=1 Tax=Candidatus Amarolinea dominans TaxID=3140696 RepID=UPI0031368640|nr:hypothetical protein [Anaerolineae bacterium]